MEEKYRRERYLQFLRYCNHLVANETEANIICAMLFDLGSLPERSVEEIAEMAHVSAPSVSRLIQKIGFSSAQEFKQVIREESDHYVYYRQLRHIKNYADSGPGAISAKLMEAMKRNLEGTQRQLDTATVLRMLEVMRHSRRVLLLGDTHEMSCFFRLQLSLCSLNVPALAIDTAFWNDILCPSFSKEDALFFVSLWDAWYTPWQRVLIEAAAAKGAKILLLSQEEMPLPGLTLSMHYGVPNSSNDGYCSLPYLSQVFTELLYC